MTKCSDCGKKISKRAKTCPECGAPNKKKTSATTYSVLLVIIFMAFASISSNSPDGTANSTSGRASSLSISSSDIGKPWSGEDWPFTLESGTLACAADAVTFSANGKKYAVNGFASSRGYADIGLIWRNNASIPGTKINIGSVLDSGLKLCR